MTSLPPNPVALEKEIFGFFAERNFERSRRFAAGAYDPQIVRNFLLKIGNPQFTYQTIHVAGTVGKGSTTTYLSRALTALGFKSAAYLSPHLVSLRERFVLDGNFIAEADLEMLWRELKMNPDFSALSFFDAMTALAFLFFARNHVDWAVVETGLGGRLDSTNNLHAKIAVITRIGPDHQNILGDTLEKIAAEKAGIIQAGQSVFTVPQDPIAMEVLIKTCKEEKATLNVIHPQGEDFDAQNKDFVRQIIATAFNPQRQAREKVDTAIAKPIFGRWTLLREQPRVVFDGAHNLPALEALALLVNRQPESQCNFFLNTMTERNLSDFCSLLRQKTAKFTAFFLFPMPDAQYYSESPAGTGLKNSSDAQITGILNEPGALNVFTGSMGLYAELRVRFAL